MDAGRRSRSVYPSQRGTDGGAAPTARCSRMTNTSDQKRGSALLAAIIGADLQAVQAELERDPSLISYRVVHDTFIESIPHWLYVGDTPLHLAAASLLDGISETLLRRGAALAATNRRGASALHTP